MSSRCACVNLRTSEEIRVGRPDGFNATFQPRRGVTTWRSEAQTNVQKLRVTRSDADHYDKHFVTSIHLLLSSRGQKNILWKNLNFKSEKERGSDVLSDPFECFLPSLLVVTGMLWTVRSLKQELVRTWSSTELNTHAWRSERGEKKPR